MQIHIESNSSADDSTSITLFTSLHAWLTDVDGGYRGDRGRAVPNADGISDGAAADRHDEIVLFGRYQNGNEV